MDVSGARAASLIQFNLAAPECCRWLATSYAWSNGGITPYNNTGDHSIQLVRRSGEQGTLFRQDCDPQLRVTEQHPEMDAALAGG